jgi:hypothetical protein
VQGDEGIGADRRIERGSPRAGGALQARDAHAPPHHYYDRYHNFHREQARAGGEVPPALLGEDKRCARQLTARHPHTQ